MKIEYELTQDDIVDFMLFDQRNAHRLFPGVRKSRWWWMLGVTWGVGAVMFGGLYWLLLFLFPKNHGQPDEPDELRFVYFVAWMLLITAMVLLQMRRPKWNRDLMAKKVQRGVNRGRHSGLGPVSLEITPECSVTVEIKGDVRIPWKSFECAVRDDNGIYLYMTPSAAQIVPRHAFADEAQFTEVFEAMDGYIKAGKSQRAIHGPVS